MDYAKALPMGRWTQELSQAVSISSGCIASEKCSDAALHIHVLSSGEKTWDWEATVVYVLVSNYDRRHSKGWDIVVPFQICICFTLGLCTWPAFIYCSLVYDTGTHWTSLYVSLDSHYRGKLAFPCIQKQLPSIYTHFIEACPQLEGHFRGLIRRAALTLNIWGLDRRCVLVSPDPYLRPRRTRSSVCSSHSFQAQLISPVIRVRWWKTNVAVLIVMLWY